MFKIHFTITILFFSLISFAQDTIFTTRNPKGLIIRSFEKRRNIYCITPFDSTAQIIKLSSKHIKQVNFANGKVEVNPKFIKYKDSVLPTNATSGRVEIIGSVNNTSPSIEKGRLNYFSKNLLNEDIYLKKINTANNENVIEYQGRFDISSDHIYFLLKIEKTDTKLHYSMSNFKMIRKNVTKLWLTVEQINGGDVEKRDIEEYYYESYQSNKFFFRDFLKKIKIIESTFHRSFDSSFEKNTAIPTTFQDTIITIQGEIKTIQVDTFTNKNLFFYTKTNEKVLLDKIKRKEIYFYKKNNEKGRIISHKHAKRKGKYKIIDQNSFFLDYVQGVIANISYYERTLSVYPNIDYKKINKNNLSAYSIRFGYKKYLYSKNLHYSLGLQLSIRHSIYLGIKGQQIVPSNLTIGYCSIYKFNERIGLEGNLNVGYGAMNIETSFSGLFSFSQFTLYRTFVLNPELKLRINNFAVGIDYSMNSSFSSNNIVQFKNLLLQTWSLTIGLNF